MKRELLWVVIVLLAVVAGFNAGQDYADPDKSDVQAETDAGAHRG